MTTSFTTSTEFGTSQGDDFDSGSNYPSAFGITFTPQVSGIAAGVSGLLLAGYLIWSQVLPAASSLSELQTKKQEQETKIEQFKGQQVEVKLQEKKAEFESVQQVKQEVLTLFADPTSLDTLLLDVNSFVKATNVQLNSFTPDGDAKVVADDSFGELAKNKVQTNSYKLDIEGNFAQIQLFLQYLERLQPLLVVRNFSVDVGEGDKQADVSQANTVIVTGPPNLKATITLDAVSVAPPPPPPPEGTPPAAGAPPAAAPPP
jgi:Tfp pilus assembly protein PilO